MMKCRLGTFLRSYRVEMVDIKDEEFAVKTSVGRKRE